jgi:hypothetical protein
MGKITDAALAIIVIIIGLWIFTRLGLTFPSIESMFHKFFFPSSGSVGNNTTAGIVMFGMATTNSRIRAKIRNRFVDLKRRIISKSYRKVEMEAKEGRYYGQR